MFKKCLGAATLVGALIMGNVNTVSAQAVEEGNILVDVYYGFPNLYSAVFKSAYASSGTEENVNLGGIGPVGGRFEYLLSDKIGLGLDVGYNNSTVSYSQTTTDGNGNTVVYDYDFKTQKLGVMATLNIHFIENDNLDFYGVVGVGYGNRSFKFTSTDPNYVESNIKGIIPVASRLGVGIRYFFTDNIGANLGLGFGQGGLINAGLSFKF